MKHTKFLLFSALLAPALLAFRLPEARVRFAPADGASIAKSFENKAEFSLDHLAMTMNGQELPNMDMDMTITSTQKITVTDEYVSVKDGRPKKLKRHFDDVSNDMTMAMKMEVMGQTNDQDKTVKSATQLEGKTVVFTWDDEAKEYKTSFDPAQDDTELLKNLSEDMDFRSLLPKDEVKDGDEWDIDVKTLAHVLAPGGNLSLVPQDEDDGMKMDMTSGMGSMSDWLSEMLEGEAKGKFTGMREVGGAKLAVIKITIAIKSSKDMTDMVVEAMKNAKLPPGAGEIKVDHMDIDFKLDGEGELLWDLAAGHAAAFEMSGPAHMNMDMAMKMSAQGQNMNIEQSMEMSGTSTMSVKFK